MDCDGGCSWRCIGEWGGSVGVFCLVLLVGVVWFRLVLMMSVVLSLCLVFDDGECCSVLMASVIGSLRFVSLFCSDCTIST